MKASMLLPEYVPGAPSGLMVHVEGLLEGMKDADVTIYARSNVDDPRIHTVAPAPVGPYLAELLGGDRTARFMANITAYNLAAYHAALDEPTDLVHAHDWLGAIAAPALAVAKSVPFLITLHSTEKGRSLGAGSPQLAKLERRAVEAADLVIVASEFMAQEARDQGCPGEKIRHVAHGLPVKDIASAPAMSAKDVRHSMGLGNAPVAVFIGRLAKPKGCRELLSAFSLAARKVDDCQLVFAGSGPDAENLKANARAKGLASRIHFIPQMLDLPHKWGLLDTADVLVLPSLYEPFGVVALEAMARGRPVLVSSIGGCAELVEDEVSGLVRDPRDRYVFGESLAELLADRERGAAFGKAAKERAGRFDRTAMCEGTLAVYRELDK
ncbi:MAG: glycosyltransferase family 4 protein [Methanopyri archaeon]|nr:glycosyltransferase family 4 protein [Methanopyri archaeon]